MSTNATGLSIHALGAALIVFATGCVGIDGWVVRPPSPQGSDERYCINQMRGSWAVATRNDRLVVAPYDPRRSRDPLPGFLRPRTGEERLAFFGGVSAIEVEDGFLVGFDRGEWGGSVEWCTATGEGCYTVTQGNPIGFVPTGDEVLVVEGLAHLSLDRGSVRSLVRAENGRWVVDGQMRLREAPKAFTVADDGSLLILTRTGVLALRDRRTSRVVTTDLDLVIPNSVAAVGDDLYVGMKYGVVHLESTPEGYRETWLVPPRCRAFDEACRCVAEREATPPTSDAATPTDRGRQDVQ